MHGCADNFELLVGLTDAKMDPVAESAAISKDMAAQRYQGLKVLDSAGLTWPNSNLRFEYVPDNSGGGGGGDDAADPWCGARTQGPTRISSGPDCGAYNCTLIMPVEASAHPSRRMHVSEQDADRRRAWAPVGSAGGWLAGRNPIVWCAVCGWWVDGWVGGRFRAG